MGAAQSWLGFGTRPDAEIRYEDLPSYIGGHKHLFIRERKQGYECFVTKVNPSTHICKVECRKGDKFEAWLVAMGKTNYMSKWNHEWNKSGAGEPDERLFEMPLSNPPEPEPGAQLNVKIPLREFALTTAAAWGKEIEEEQKTVRQAREDQLFAGLREQEQKEKKIKKSATMAAFHQSSRPSYALVFDVEKTGCDMIRNNMVSFGVVLMNLTLGAGAPPNNFCAEFSANMPWGFGAPDRDWAIGTVTEDLSEERRRGRTVMIAGWVWEVASLEEHWNYKRINKSELAMANRRRMLESCLQGGSVDFTEVDAAASGGMQGSPDQPLENNQIMRAFGKWLSSFPNAVKNNLVIMSDNPAFDIATINYYMAQAEMMPMEKFLGGYKRVLCTSSFHKGLGQQYFDETIWGSEDASYDFYKSSNVSLMMSSNFDDYKEKACPFVHDHTPLNDAKSVAWDFWLFRTLTRDSQRK